MFDIALIIDVLVSMLLGSMLFFAIIVTPAAFSALQREQAAVYMRRLFPRYFLWGIFLSTTALLLCLFHMPKGAVLLIFVLAGFLYSRQILLPAIHDVKEALSETDSPQLKAQVAHLHKRSVIINSVQMAILLVIIIA